VETLCSNHHSELIVIYGDIMMVARANSGLSMALPNFTCGLLHPDYLLSETNA